MGEGPETGSARVDAPPAHAATVFADRLPLAVAYAELLATAGIERGLIGPREAPRLWERHLLNCAAVSDLLPAGARVVDVGSGAGLPGLVLAIRRPDLRVDLVESLQRRTDFLAIAIGALALGGQVRVARGRAEDPAVVEAVGAAEWVTARAVAPLDRLSRWCLPLLVPGGTLLAIKGASAQSEVATHADAIRRAGGRDVRIVELPAPGSGEAGAVIVVRRGGKGSR